jgi:hypothetical protein
MRPKHTAQKGQSLVEACFVVPVCLLLFMGVYTAGTFISDLDVAGQAVRAGARLGAEVGDFGYASSQEPSPLPACMTSSTDPCAIDKDIVTSVSTIAKGMQNVSSIIEIDIYDPCAVAGSCTSGAGSTSSCTYQASGFNGSYQTGDPADVYTLQGGVWTLQGSAGYTLDKRSQNHPNETAVGVRILYQYQAAAPIQFFNVQAAQFATMCLAPHESGG